MKMSGLLGVLEERREMERLFSFIFIFSENDD